MTTDYSFTDDELQRIQGFIGRYPDKRAAVMPALWLAQEKFGWLPQAAIKAVATAMELPPAHVYGVASFYTMYYKEPVGKYHLQVCTNISCWLRGSNAIVEHLCSTLGVGRDVVTGDGLFTISEVECLGSCGSAPMLQVGHVYLEGLTNDKVDEIVRLLAAGTDLDALAAQMRPDWGATIHDAQPADNWQRAGAAPPADPKAVAATSGYGASQSKDTGSAVKQTGGPVTGGPVELAGKQMAQGIVSGDSHAAKEAQGQHGGATKTAGAQTHNPETAKPEGTAITSPDNQTISSGSEPTWTGGDGSSRGGQNGQPVTPPTNDNQGKTDERGGQKH